MAEYQLHCFAQSGNAYKVALYLQLVGADWQPIFVDYFANVTRTPAWRDAINVMGEVPVLKHGEKTLTQSGLILHYLADRFGRYAATSTEERGDIWRWILFDNHKFTSYFATHRWLRTFAEPKGKPEVLDFLRSRIESAFGVVEAHLSQHAFLVGNRLTIADFSLAGYLFFPESETGFNLAESFPHISAWTTRIASSPGWRESYDLMPTRAGESVGI